MTNNELRIKLGELVKTERKLNGEILKLIVLALEREAYREFRYTSLFDWLTREYGYAPASAQRRIDAAFLMRSVPEAEGQIESGELNLTTASKIQIAIKTQEKVSNVTQEAKEEALYAVKNKTIPQAEKILVQLFPATKSSVHQERRQVIDENTTRHSMNLPNEAADNLKRAKDLLSHKFPHATDAEIVAYALEFLLDKTDPLRSTASAAEVKSKAETYRQVVREAEGKCEYCNPFTGEVCGSTYQVQVDHKLPRSLGGGDERENLRVLCRQHNLLAAEEMGIRWRSA